MNWPSFFLGAGIVAFLWFCGWLGGWMGERENVRDRAYALLDRMEKQDRERLPLRDQQLSEMAFYAKYGADALDRLQQAHRAESEALAYAEMER